MKKFVSFVDDLNDLDKAAWMEIIKRAEAETGNNLTNEVNKGQEEGYKVWTEIFPFVQVIRLGLASNTLSRTERSRIVGAVLFEISGLLSPMELSGTCLAVTFKQLHGTSSVSMVVPFPFGIMEPEMKKDETRTVV